MVSKNDAAEVLTLKTPFPVATGMLTELCFRRAKAKDLIKSDVEMWGDGYRFELKLIAELTGLTLIQIEEMDGHDVTRAMGVTAGFLMRGPKTGEKPLDTSPKSSGSEGATSSS